MLAGKTNALIKKVIFPELKVLYGTRKGCAVWPRLDITKLIQVHALNDTCTKYDTVLQSCDFLLQNYHKTRHDITTLLAQNFYWYLQKPGLYVYYIQINERHLNLCYWYLFLLHECTNCHCRWLCPKFRYVCEWNLHSFGPLYGAERSFDANILGYLAGPIFVCQIIQEECQVLRWASGYIRTGEDGDWFSTRRQAYLVSETSNPLGGRWISIRHFWIMWHIFICICIFIHPSSHIYIWALNVSIQMCNVIL